MANTPTVTMRLPPDLVARIDAYAARIAKQTGVEVSRTAAMKALVQVGLEVKEKEAGQ